MTNFRKTNLSDKKTSYEVSLILAKNGKGFRDRETVKKCAIFCLLFVRTDVAVCGPGINIQKIIWPATLSTLDHPDVVFNCARIIIELHILQQSVCFGSF